MVNGELWSRTRNSWEGGRGAALLLLEGGHDGIVEISGHRRRGGLGAEAAFEFDGVRARAKIWK